MDAYKLCSADKDLNPKTCKFSAKCKPGYTRDEKFLCKKSADVAAAKASLQSRLASYLQTGQNKTLGLNIKQLKKKLTGKDGQITNSLNRMLEQIKEHQERNPSKRTRTMKKKAKPENRLVLRARSNSSGSIRSRSRSRSRSTVNSPNMMRQASIGSVNSSVKGYKDYAAQGRKPVGKYQNQYGVPLAIKM